MRSKSAERSEPCFISSIIAASSSSLSRYASSALAAPAASRTLPMIGAAASFRLGRDESTSLGAEIDSSQQLGA